MKCVRTWLGFFLVWCVMATPALAELEWNVLATQKFDKAPLDVVFSQSDGRIIVLLEGGEIQVLAPNGLPQDAFTVPGATSLNLTPDGQRLLVGNTEQKALQVIEIATVHQLPVGKSPVKGTDDAVITLTVFDDFQCPYCARLVPVLDQVVDSYAGKVRLVFKHFPLRNHKFAQPAAVASLAAREQGKFWELHDQLFANFNKLNENKIRELAEAVGLDMARFDEDLKNPAYNAEIQADMRLGQQVGVRGTPSLFLNGKLIRDRNPNGLRLAIDRELAKIKRQ